MTIDPRNRGSHPFGLPLARSGLYLSYACRGEGSHGWRCNVNINDLLNGKPVEWERLEFKAGWNPEAVLHALCAFANDIHNLCGGYVLIGVAELMAIAERVNCTKFRDQVLKPLLAGNLLAMTIPDKPTSRNQRYRTTEKGWAVLVATGEGGA